MRNMKTRIGIVSVIASLSLLATSLFAQLTSTPVSGGGTSGNSNTPGIPVAAGSAGDAIVPQVAVGDSVIDLSAITNYAELVSRELDNVKGVMIRVTASADANAGGGQWSYYSFTNAAKTLEDIEAMVTNTYYGFELVSTDNNSTISEQIKLYNVDDEYAIINGTTDYNGEPIARVLFQGFNGGVPFRNQYGQLTLPDYAETLSIQMLYDVFVNVTNISSARLLYTNVNGQWLSMNLSVVFGKGFHFPPQFAGQGIIVLGILKQTGPNSYSYSEHAYSLHDNGAEIQMQWAFAKVILADSDDFKTSVNSTNLSYDLYSYEGFGKVPLLTPTYTTPATNVYVSVMSSQLGKGGSTVQAWATSYKIINVETKAVSKVTVPTGAVGTWIPFAKGKYRIIPIGLELLPWELYGWYGGKG